jgi:hypothetical protein
LHLIYRLLVLLQLRFHWTMFSILVALTLLRKYIIKNTQTLVSVELINGGNLLLNFWGSLILSCGIIMISSLTRSWEVWKMCTPLVLVRYVHLSHCFSHVLASVCF